MKVYKNLTIIGTSHIAKQSVDEVKKVILDSKPAVVALELDKNRLFGLLNKEQIELNKKIEKKNSKKNKNNATIQKSDSEPEQKKYTLKEIRQIGFKGYLFSLAGEYFERKMGEQSGVAPGNEMLAGYHAAKSVGSRVALVDQDITITLKKFSEKITWREKGRFLKDVFKSLFFTKQMLKKYGVENLDLKKVPSEKVIKTLTLYLKDNYPNVHYVLVEERNQILAKNLFNLMCLHQDEQIVAVVGAGHVDEILELIKKKEKE